MAADARFATILSGSPGAAVRGANRRRRGHRSRWRALLQSDIGSHANARAANACASTLAERQQPERAARLLSAALEFYRRTGTAMQWCDTACEHAVRDALRAQLDEQTLHALIDEGRTMTLEQTVQKECHDAEQRA